MRNFLFSIHIAKNTFKDVFNSRIFPFFMAFCALLVYFSMVLGLMAVDEEKRVLLNFGLAMVELSSFSFILFLSSLAINKEMETKTIYMILARPVPRKNYILGKLIGLYMLSAFIVSSVSLIHISLLVIRGFPPDKAYFLAVLSSALKVALISSVALFSSISTSSSFSGIIISIMLWVFGNFSQEIKYLAEKAALLKKFFLLSFMYVFPNFHILNLTESVSPSATLYSFAYFFLYATILGLLSSIVFEKKEF